MRRRPPFVLQLIRSQPTPMNTLPTMTAAELNAAIASGAMRLTRLPRRGPRKGEATANRVGGGGTAWRPSVAAGHANRHIRSGSPALR